MLPVEPDTHWGTPCFQYPNFEDGSQQIPTGDLIGTTNNGLEELSKSCSPDLTRTQMDSTGGPASIKIVSSDGFSTEPDAIFASSENDFSNFAGGSSLWPYLNTSNWVADTSMESPFKNEEVLEFGAPMSACSRIMYSHSSEGLDAANSSCQTLFSTSSSDGDAYLMTPPLKTSPMPTLPPELEVRRGSSSSELAKTFDTIRLQQPRSRTGLRDEVFCSPPPSDAERPLMSEPQMAMNGSPATMSLGKVGGKTSPGPGIDLASRRKRPRPPALRPDSQRSHSCAAPLTLSPHSQVSSIGISSTPSIRRIRSTGQNLNVTSGGVQKPGLRAAQLSPRNLQSFLDATRIRQSSPIKRESIDPAETSASHGKPPTPLTPGKVELHPDVSSNFAPYATYPAFRWGANDQDAHYALAAGHEITSPPITPFNADAFPQMLSFERPQDPSYQCPPQSAPPEQTTFSFGDSPPIAPVANHSVWRVPSATMPISTYYDDSTLAMARPAPMPIYNFPKPSYPQMGPPQGYSHGAPNMTSGRSAFFGAPPAPPKEFEIQVNLIPKPQGVPQTKKQYTFNHTTPKDFSSSLYPS